MSDSKSKTLATLGQGTVTIGGKESQTDSTLNRDISSETKDIYSVDRTRGNINLSVDHRLLSEEGRKEIKEDIKRTEILGTSIYDTATNDGVSLLGDQENGQTSLREHIGEDQKYFDASKKFVNDPKNKKNVEALNNPNATPEEKQKAYTALASYISKEMGVTPAEAKLIVDKRYSGAFHQDGKAGTIYVNDLKQNSASEATNTIGHETTHSIDYQNDKDIVKTENYENNREEHAELMGDHTEDYMNYEYASNGYTALGATNRHNEVIASVNNPDSLLMSNTRDFRAIEPQNLDYRQVISILGGDQDKATEINTGALLSNFETKDYDFSNLGLKGEDLKEYTEYHNQRLKQEVSNMQNELRAIYNNSEKEYFNFMVRQYGQDTINRLLKNGGKEKVKEILFQDFTKKFAESHASAINAEDFDTTMVALPIKIKELDPDTKIKIFDSGQKSVVVESIINDYENGEQIILQGHSAGGGDVQDVAEILNDKNIKNVVTIQIDSVEPFGDDASVSPNVTKAINAYQTESSIIINGETNIHPSNLFSNDTEIVNKEFTNIKGPAPVENNPYASHQNIDNSHEVQEFIQNEVLPVVELDIFRERLDKIDKELKNEK